jgi:hypothetical protein
MNEEYIKKLEEENARLSEKMAQLEKKEIELDEKDKKLDAQYLNFNSYVSGKCLKYETLTRIILQLEHENNLDLSEPKELAADIEQWKENIKELHKHKPLKITWTQYEKINEEGRTPNLDDYTEHMYHLERMMGWKYENLSDEAKKEYDKCRDYLDNLLDKFARGEK